MLNNSLGDVFINKGAGAVLGYTDTVGAGFAKDHGEEFFEAFIEDGDTVGEAHTQECESSGDPHPACFVMRGYSDLTLPVESQIQNSSFESGGLAPWSSSGDGRVIGQLGSYSPTNGSLMGVISTGLGFTVNSGSISQRACLQSNIENVEFRWNFLSAEFKEWCGTIYQDFFSVQVEVDGKTNTIFSRKVDDLCGQVTSTNLKFDQPDVWATGWKSESVDIKAIVAANKDKSAVIKFSVGDVGDSIYDTVVLLDEIKLKKTWWWPF